MRHITSTAIRTADHSPAYKLVLEGLLVILRPAVGGG